jgi:hypothetical protein
VAQTEEAIREVGWKLAELGRVKCRKVFHYNRVWNGKFYSTKECGRIALPVRGPTVLWLTTWDHRVTEIGYV